LKLDGVSQWLDHGAVAPPWGRGLKPTDALPSQLDARSPPRGGVD